MSEVDTGEAVYFRLGDRVVDGWGRDAPDGAADEDEGYSTWSAKQLATEVKARELEPAGKTKAAYIAALEADDEENPEDEE